MQTELRAPLTTRLWIPALVVADVVVALLLMAPVAARVLSRGHGPGFADLLDVLVALPVAVRRIWPVPVFGMVLVTSVVATIVAVQDGKGAIAAAVTDDLTGRISAVDLVRAGVEVLGGKGGGGRPDMAQGGGPDGSKGAEAIAAVRRALAEAPAEA